jgi:hypothetical protein
MLTLDDFLANGLNAEEIHPQLFMIHDFLTDADLQDLDQIIATIDEDGWSQLYLRNIKSMARETFGMDDLDLLVKEGKIRLTEGWIDKVALLEDTDLRNRLKDRIHSSLVGAEIYEVPGFGTIQRQYEGVPLKAHVDQDGDQLIAYAAVAYITDDYTDGELYFPRIGLELKPKRGTLMIFPGSSDFEHGVHAVGPGPVRYVIPAFIAYNDESLAAKTDTPRYRYNLVKEET